MVALMMMMIKMVTGGGAVVSVVACQSVTMGSLLTTEVGGFFKGEGETLE